MDYAEAREFIRTGDLIQWSGTGLMSFLIKARTSGMIPDYEKLHGIEVSHSSLAIRMPLYEGTEHRVWTTEAVESGTVLSLLSRELEDFDGRVWIYRLRPEFDYLREMAACNAFRYIGIPYDTGALIDQMLGRVIADTSRLFCSEYVQLCYLGDASIGCLALVPNELPSLGLFEEPIEIAKNND